MGNTESGESNVAPRPAQATASDAMSAISNITKSKETMEKRVDFLEKKIDGEMKKAKAKMKKKDKRGALVCLKRKKLYQKQVDSAMNQIMNLEMNIMNLQQANTSASVVASMKQAATAIGDVMAKVDIDEVEDLQDDLEELTAMGDEVNEALGRQIGQDIDEDELEAELMELEELEADGELLGMPEEAVEEAPVASPMMPEAPTGVPQIEVKEEEELAELEALMT